jgi:ATP-dependent helicase/nuclease subunit B
VSAEGFPSKPGRRWFSIPAHRPFLTDLALGLREALDDEALSQAVVLTPNRRAARALAEAFVATAGGGAILPPQIRALGDLDEGEPPFEPGDLALDLPPAVSPWRRRFELASICAAEAHRLDYDLGGPAALDMAQAVGGLFDSLAIEEVEAQGRLVALADADLARHWTRSADFLEAVLAAWKARLAQLGRADVSERRVALLRGLAEQWRREPPRGVVVAAGSTGTAPATAGLLAVIADLPRGAVILPGLDDGLADSAWAKIDDQHPQYALKRLLETAGMTRGEVRPWRPDVVPGDMAGRWRRRIVGEAMRPAEATADWLDQIESLRAEAAREDHGGIDPVVAGLAGLSVIGARHEDEAAAVCALLMREAVETPGKTCALITPDPDLARRVSARLTRWGLSPEGAAGVALAASAPMRLAQDLSALAVDRFDPVLWLAVLKHPAARLGLAVEEIAPLVAVIERHALRGPRPRSLEEIEARLTAKVGDEAGAAIGLARKLVEALAPFHAVFEREISPADAGRRLVEAMEVVAGPELWSAPGGEASGVLLAAVIAEGDALPPVDARGFDDLLRRLAAGETVRTGGAAHPRLAILGAVEARLVRPDRIILAGLEEGVWPRGAEIDPFLSRPMRAALGLPSPERRVGLQAHDFAQAAAAPDVAIVHAERRGGAPAVESRWLWRLRTLAKGAGVDLPGRPEVLAWARALDAPAAYRPAPRPAPVPPVEHRPTAMAVTRVEALTRDPYAVWARDILRLYRLDRPDEPTDARARGSAIHEAFEHLALDWERIDDPAAHFERLYLDALRAWGAPPSALAREQALAREAARWVADLERRRRADGRRIVVEQKGELTLDLPDGPFTINARADRIELTPDGLGHILDYKTGHPPSQKMVETGFSPQLTLTAAILMAGGFEGLGTPTPGDLTYLQVSGRRPAGREEVRAAGGAEAEAAAVKALDGLRRLVNAFRDPARGYASRTAPQFVRDYPGDYGHLARVFEWSTSGEEEE